MQLSPTTAPTHSEIEAIVRAVLQRLHALDVAPAAAAAAPVVAVAVAPPGEVRLEQRLVTLADLRDRWGSMKSLLVPTRCVVTPAAQDELRQRGVVLQRFDGENKPAGSARLANALQELLIMIPAGKKSEAIVQLGNQGAEIAAIAQDCSLALSALQYHFSETRKLCLWSSPRPFAAVRACASVSQVAAVQLSRLDELSLAIEQAQPNVIILDDRIWTASSVANLARMWMVHQSSRSSN